MGSLTVEAGKFPFWISPLLAVVMYSAFLWLEHRRPLRRAVESKLARNLRNFTIAALGAVAVQLAELPVVMPLAALVEQRRWGLVNLAGFPVWAEVAVALMLLDYTLYVWHVLTHCVPWLWRFHVVHHADLDMDASTALRFHFGELIISVPWRAGQIFLIGVSPLSLVIWQAILFAMILFHHSNVRLPIGIERRLNLLVVTPRMHGIHHSIVREETDSNWSSGLTLWDWLHGTLRLGVPQEEITIGVPAYRIPRETSLLRMLKLPFTKQRPSWQLPEGGRPTRLDSPVTKNRLAA
jgi:sterol desaturase/sphingolipid hydroxylase (fatty acid hydroxylase superfamily)